MLIRSLGRQIGNDREASDHLRSWTLGTIVSSAPREPTFDRRSDDLATFQNRMNGTAARRWVSKQLLGPLSRRLVVDADERSRSDDLVRTFEKITTMRWHACFHRRAASSRRAMKSSLTAVPHRHYRPRLNRDGRRPGARARASFSREQIRPLLRS